MINAHQRHIHEKIMPFICIIFGALFLIICRLCYLQIKQWDYFKERSTKNFLRIERIPSLRGNIIDSHGTILATNRPVVSLLWHGTGNNILSEEQKQLCAQLCATTQGDENSIIPQIMLAEKKSHTVVITRDISFETLCFIAESWGGHPNIRFETDFERYYPHGHHACHVVGYLGHINSQSEGVMGLEHAAHTDLRGIDGTKQKRVNSQGHELESTIIDQGHMGDTVQTTLDSNLQQIAEEIFPNDCAGALIIMDPEDGAVKAVLSRPCFDPSIFLKQITPSQWQILQKNQPFLNRVSQACYPIGSVFKLVTVSAALEHKIISPTSALYCGGYYEYKQRKYWCHQRRGHGKLSTLEAVAHSCNILFFDIGSRIDVDLIATYARKFGFGNKTGVILPEKQGIVPSRTWKYENRGEPWWQGETLSVAIGQGPLIATPIQVARMISAIFTGYLVRPRLLVTEPMEKQPLDIQPETRNFLKESMDNVVQRGTGRRVRNKGMTIYAKTSTAQVSDLSKRHQDKKHLEHGWFVAHVTYKNEKPFTLVIVAEHAGSSQVSADIAKQFLNAYKKQIDAQHKQVFNKSITTLA